MQHSVASDEEGSSADGGEERKKDLRIALVKNYRLEEDVASQVVM